MGTLGSPKNAFFFSRTLLHTKKEIGDVCTQANVCQIFIGYLHKKLYLLICFFMPGMTFLGRGDCQS